MPEQKPKRTSKPRLSATMQSVLDELALRGPIMTGGSTWYPRRGSNSIFFRRRVTCRTFDALHKLGKIRYEVMRDGSGEPYRRWELVP